MGALNTMTLTPIVNHIKYYFKVLSYWVSLLLLILLYVFYAIYFDYFYKTSNYHTAMFLSILLLFLFVLMLLLSFVFRKTNIILSYIISFIFGTTILFETVLIIYRATRRVPLDFNYFWFNRNVAFETLYSVNKFSLLVMVFILLATLFLTKALFESTKFLIRKTDNAKGKYLLFFSLILIIPCTLYLYKYLEIVNFTSDAIRKDSSIASIYNKYYFEDLNEVKSIKIPITTQNNPNIFFVQQESLNSILATKEIIPQMYSIGEKYGVIFPHLQTLDVITMRSQESFLCGLLPSIGESISLRVALSENMKCLPEVLKENGYKTLFFQAYDLRFSNTGIFMKNIGFEELHSSDIMYPDDPKTNWGYTDEIFLQRVNEYIQKYKNQKIFVYIVLETTNHYPFVDKYIETENLLIKKPKSESDRFINTLHMQDIVFGNYFYKYYLPEWSDNSILFTYGDHSMIAQDGSGNTFNGLNSTQQEFSTTLLVVPPQKNKNDYRIGYTVENLYSQLDIIPTLENILGITNTSLHGKTFADELVSKTDIPTENNGCLVSVQPFSFRWINLIKYPYKYVFSLKQDTVDKYNLENDPDEKQPLLHEKISATYTELINDCLKPNF